MRSGDSDGISIYGQQPDEASEGRVQKALQVVEVYVDQSRMFTVIKANGAKNQTCSTLNDYIIPKIEKNRLLVKYLCRISW